MKHSSLGIVIHEIQIRCGERRSGLGRAQKQAKMKVQDTTRLARGGRVGGQNMTTRVHGLNLSDRVWYKTVRYILNYYNPKGVSYQCKSEFA